LRVHNHAAHPSEQELNHVSAPLTRGQLLSRSAKRGAALLVAGSAVGALVDVAAAAPLPTTDLAYARLLVGAELLASDFYTQALAAANTGPTVTKYLKLAYANEQEHYQSVAGIVSGAGQTPAVAGDIDFSYPDGTFDSQGSIIKFAQQLETTILGAYLGAIGGIQTDELKTGIARIAACEAQHASYFATVMGGKAFNLSFPSDLAIDQASNALDAYTA
jgi:rubrerythrin